MEQTILLIIVRNTVDGIDISASRYFYQNSAIEFAKKHFSEYPSVVKAISVYDVRESKMLLKLVGN